MTITLLNKRDYNNLLEIQKKYPNLTFQNDGYQYLRGHVKLTKKDEQAIRVVELNLQKSVQGFSEFNNFRLGVKKKGIEVRLRYKWHYSFVGVGYVVIQSLRHGFSYMEHGSIFFQEDNGMENSVEERVAWIKGLNASGFAGVKSDGNIVDRREFPDAIEVPANEMLGVAEPKTHNFTV